MRRMHLIFAALLAAAIASAHAAVFINEIHYDNASDDVDEFVEVVGPAGSDASSYSIVLYNGNGGAPYGTKALTGTFSGSTSGYGTVVVPYPLNGIQNGDPDGLALVQGNTVVQFLCYEGVITATSGPASGQTCTDIGVKEDASTAVGQSLQLTGTGCIPGAGLTWVGPLAASRGTINNGQTINCGGTTTPPVTPPAPTPPVTCGTFTRIAAIQGDGATSPKANTVVDTQGVVTATFVQLECGVTGYWLQDANGGDNNPQTSEGLYVIGDTTAVNIGDVVVIRGTVREQFTVTVLDAALPGPVQRASCGTAPVPPPILLDPLPTLAEQNVVLEPLEGMRIRLPQPLVVTDTFTLGRFGELRLNQNYSYMGSPTSPQRSWTSTQVYAPSGQSVAYVAAQRQILLDDGRSCQNLDPVLFGDFDYNNPIRVGDTVPGGQIEGILTRDFNLWRVLPTVNKVEIEHTNPRPATPPNVLAGSCAAPAAPGPGRKLLQEERKKPGTDAASNAACSARVLASYNVLNFFNGIAGDFCSCTGNNCNPTPECSDTPRNQDNRGAYTAQEFQRQRTKIVSGIVAIDATVLGLIEIENDGFGPNSAIVDLVNAINARLPAEKQYTIITQFNGGVGPDGFVGTDAIANKIIYRAAEVTPKGPTAVLKNDFPAGFTDFAANQRPTLAQTFVDLANGGEFTIVVNHWKSKGSGCTDDAGPDLGAGNCDITRTKTAGAVARWLATNPTDSAKQANLVIGDLNAYAMENPIKTMAAAGYTNTLQAMYGVTGPYSYVFDGASGYLDHALANAAMLQQINMVAEWHINADEPVAFEYILRFKDAAQQVEYYGETPYRSSDHDPVLVGTKLQPNAVNLYALLANALSSTSASAATGRRPQQGLDAKLLEKLQKNYEKSLEAYNNPKKCDTDKAVQEIEKLLKELRKDGGASSQQVKTIEAFATALVRVLPAAPGPSCRK